jgi:hypothetical protein
VLERSSAITRCAPTRAKAMLALKRRWRERKPLKPGEMQVGTPEWMKNRPEYRHNGLAV